LHNTGDYDCYVGWKVSGETPLPEDVTLTAWGQGVSSWEQNNFEKFLYADDWWTVNWCLTIDGDAPRGLITFDILFLAADTSSG